MRRLLSMAAALVLVALMASPAMAQSGRFYFRDDGGRLDRSQVQRAAQPLLDRGAYVAVYAVNSGKGTEFLSALADDGLRNGDTVNPNLVAIFVSFNDRYSEIRYGDKWKGALDSGASGSIQQSTLNPALASGNFTDAFVKTLGALNSAIASGGSTGSTGTAAPAQTGGGVPWYGWLVGLLALVGIPVGWSNISKRQAAAKSLAQARTAMEDARRKAGAAIADTAQLMADSREKAQFDKLSYTEADVAQLASWQEQAESTFGQAQDAFKQAEESLAATRQPTEANYQGAVATYGQVAATVEQARALAAQAEGRRAELDKLGAAAPGKVDQAKKALADAAGRLGVLGDGVQPEVIARPIQALLDRAESLLAEHRAADAIAAAEAASAQAAELDEALGRFGGIREQISEGRAGAERAAGQGYRVDAGLAALSTAEGVLAQAARALEQGGVAQASPLLDQAASTAAEGVAAGAGLPATREANGQRIGLLRKELADVGAHIGEGRRAFDMVDEFAEATWSDIRGNGSEAEAAHAEAAGRVDRAEAGNTMETQQFLAASKDLDTAAERLAYARTLIDTIIQRLKDLEAARAAAKDEVAAAQKDVDAGWAFVRGNDADVGKEPEQALAQAAELLRQAGLKLQQQRPNWLEVVKLAQAANQKADEALAEARGEVESMDKLREQLARAQQVATGEVQKVAQFAGLHSRDIPADSQARLGSLQNDVQMAYATAKAVEGRVEEARAAALRDAVAQYTALQQRAEAVYQEIYAAFQQAEGWRQRVASARRDAEQAISEAERQRAQVSGLVSFGSSGDRLLQEAKALLDDVGSVSTQQQMQRAVQTAEEARVAARRAESEYRQIASTYQAQQRDQTRDVLTGMVIGSILNSGGGGHHGGHHGGGGGGGGGWGGGGSSGGGSWGGGGSSGGSSWGGGGSSGGSGW